LLQHQVLLQSWKTFMAAPTDRILSRPAKDEWGVYDPEQAGLAALFARLDSGKKVVPALPPSAAKPEKPEPHT
jgi:hypothetical protein